MSGHSKWANIKRKKSKVDEERGKIFTKISREIAVAVRASGPDPDGNFRLKLCIQNAKSANMPSDNIKRCIEKAAGIGENVVFEEFYYEGYGVAGVAVLCSMVTDNRNRTASEIRYIFSRNNGNLGETGCVAWMFDRKGQMLVDCEGKDLDELMMLVLEAGAEDVLEQQGEDEELQAEIITSSDDLEAVRDAVEAAGYNILSADITMLSQNTIEITDPAEAAKLLKLIDALEDNDDVQAVYANFDIPDEVMEQIE